MIRELTVHDFAIAKALRLDALEHNPEAFGTSVEEERLQTREVFEESLKNSFVFGYFMGEQMVGMAGYYLFKLQKMRHRCQLFGVYVLPKFRGRGIATKLIKTVCEDAGRTMQQIHLNVWTGNPEAIALYRKLGFEMYGTEPGTMMIDGVKIDDHLMVRQL